MSEVLFYHLEHQKLEQVLPLLLDKTLQRGWRAVVQTNDENHVASLSNSIWTWREDSFLAHGSKAQGNGEYQPIWLCSDDETPNGAQVRFCVNGTTAATPEQFERTIYMFDGNDEAAVLHARQQWKKLKDTELEITYWRQDANGRWEKKA